MAAAFFATPELVLENNEARVIAEALGEVNKHYKIPGLRPDHASVASLIIVLLTIYGKRVYILANKKPSQIDSSSKPCAENQEINDSGSWFPTDIGAVN